MKKDWWILGGIFILSFCLRIYQLDLLPLYPDETGHYYYYWWVNAHWWWQNPIDWVGGHLFSLTWLLGLTVSGVRFPVVFWGSFFPILMYWLIGKFQFLSWKDQRIIGLISALFIAVLPWSYMLSRIGHTHIIFLLFCEIGLIGFYLQRKWWLALVCWLIGSYWYPSFIVISPVILGLIGKKIYASHLHFKSFYFTQKTLMLFVFFLIFFGIFFQKYAGFTNVSRGVNLAVWNDVNVTADTNNYRGIARESEPSLFSFGKDTELLGNKFFYNKLVAIFREFGERYLSFWSSNWLFLQGDPLLRHSTGMVGMFWWWTAPFMVAGAWYFFTKAKNDEKYLLGWLLIVSPVPAAITSDGAGYLLRAVTMLPILTFFVAVGIVKGYHYLCQNLTLKIKNIGIIFISFVSLLLIASSWYFYYGYFHVYPVLAVKSFEDGWKELADWQTQHGSAPMLVIWQGYYGDSVFRFWQQTPVGKFTPARADRFSIGASVFYQTFDNLYFGWPSSFSDLESFLYAHPEIGYVVFPGGYIDENLEYRGLGKRESFVNGKYERKVFEIIQIWNGVADRSIGVQLSWLRL